MPKFISVNEAALILGLNPQTVYRKLSRGELKGVRIGRTIRFDPNDLLLVGSRLQNSKSTSNTTVKIPSFVEPLFWDINPKNLTPADPIVLERVLDQGDIAQVRWLFDNRRTVDLVAFLRSQRSKRLSQRSRNFWFNYWGLSHEEKDISKSAKKSLGETDWR